MDYLLILVGFIILIVGAHFLVDGASGMAKRFNVSNLIIGLTVVAFGTSAPELVVNLVAALNPGTTDIALTNIIGSNMINTYVILGVAALIYPIVSQKSSRRFDMPLSLMAPVAVLLLVWGMNGQVNRAGGLILLLFFIWFMTVMIRKAMKHPEEAEEDFKPMKIWLAIIMILGGLGGLIGGAQLIVPSATRIAESWGVSQSVIGLTIVALGTSLPELATSAVAAFKKNSDIALGNVVGSNIFNVFFVLAVSAIIRPLPAYSNIYTDLIITALGSLLILIFVYTNKTHSIKRWGGVTLLLIYSAFLYWMIAG
ncbi:MAG: calcium/sodium antiporter [Bacteroidia bacterium]|nr:calcium/sodium antiporter [Paludibacter sp.]MDD3490744.1 calcium/sodium antiporter [Paludibacter sp.]NCB69158.1 calcium/sodium antiporter [Bacteroidia bacterium]